MRLVTLSQEFQYSPGLRVPAGLRVVMPDHACRACRAMAAADKCDIRISGIGNYVRPYCGQDLTGKTLCVWRGAGIGDHFVWSGLLAELHRRWPSAEIDSYVPAHPALLKLWSNSAGLGWQTFPEPIPFDDFRSYDYHLLGEHMSETDSEPDCGNLWDAMFARAGLDPDHIATDRKRPCFALLPADFAAAEEIISGLGRVILWQAMPANAMRAYPPEPTREALRLLCTALPEHQVLCLGFPRELAAYRPLPKLPNLRELRAPPLGVTLALMHRAALLVCPDSSLGNAAGAFPHLPVVSLWGPFAPADRISYFGNHHTISGQRECAPCRWNWGRRCPQARKRDAPYCRALAAIDPREIVCLAKGALGS